ncbi:MAG TPA: M23 family metallopeptidase [Vicinamibacterales bacterium]|nr:M23 family metallopeptidase [Vicinamibacterales bacterium]
MLKACRFVLVGGALALASCARPDPVRAPIARGDIQLPREFERIDALMPRHATLDSLLRAHHISEDLVTDAVAAARAVFDPRRMRAGRPYRIEVTLDGLLREFIYEIDTDRFLRIVRGEREKPSAEVVPFEKQTAIAAIDARLEGETTSLIAAINESGETIALALELADIFGGQVDFNNDLQPGDSFKLLFEKATRDGAFSNYGALLAAAITVDGREMQAFRWTDPATGKAAYYDENGRSLKRFFLKSPLKFEPRITSRFSMRRFHPVDKVYRAHLGVDYGAPAGSAVLAVANGVVVSARYSGGGGNTVQLRHPGGFETYYLHLSSFGPGIRAGARVSQGQLIGRVGSTGTATGPHLDYRLKRGGAFVNPVSVHARQAPGEPIPAAHLARFTASRADALARMRATLLAAASPAPRADIVRAAR